MNDKPDPRSRGGWLAKDDQIVFYIFGVCPFLDIKQYLRLMPNKSPADIYHRFIEIMNNPTLQKRLLNEYGNNIIYKSSLKFSETENYVISKIAEESPKNCTKFIASYPYLFNPTRPPLTVTKAVTRMKQENNSISERNKKFTNFVESIHKKATLFEAMNSIKSKSSINSLISNNISNITHINTIRAIDGMSTIVDSLPSIDEPPKPRKKLSSTTPAILRDTVSSVPKGTRTLEDYEAYIYSQFQDNDLSALFGYLDIHRITKTQVYIGRSSPKIKSDIDLAPYNMQTVCRQHCIISFCSDTKFYLTVLGRDVIINSQLFYKGQIIQLKNRDMIDIGGVPLMFIENPRFRKKLDELNLLDNEIV
ncbi:hypothetical protein TRFO_08312 [Tritrichomonas foetus]|uniref:FHA domain-containing protein n=1 Tax=Tritrichomonas foetus TaxID=1144522 RepID=A0A1J4JQ80_9EUKA|nr:hypothetical protein TRFO_08312 [Tritrichomonas foetus]|eukprot:OHS99675.1 hypothetical protein TRFO_08312 [Tritrichomonas foetus]